MQGTKESGGGNATQGRNACLLSAWPRWGGKQAGPGQPLPLRQGVDAGGWVPRTQNKPACYFQVLLWTLSKVPGEKEGAVGRGESRAGEGCWERAGVDGGLTGQRGKALIRTPASEALCPSWAPPVLCLLSLLEPHPPLSCQASSIQASFASACCSNNNHWERQQRHWLSETLLLSCSRDTPSPGRVLGRDSHRPTG